MFRNYTVCVHVHNLHPGTNLHHLEGRSEFAPGKFAPGCKFLKHRSHGQKYTPGANCAHERGFRFLYMLYYKKNKRLLHTAVQIRYLLSKRHQKSSIFNSSHNNPAEDVLYLLPKSIGNGDTVNQYRRALELVQPSYNR